MQKVGYISLIEQSKTFDENSGVPFWTYACKGVKLKMLEELRFILDTVSISPYLNKQIGKGEENRFSQCRKATHPNLLKS